MKLLVLSDVHLELAPFELARGIDFDVAILAGDIGAPGERALEWMLHAPALHGKDVVWVLGNHEFYETHMPTLRARLQARTRGCRIHLLDGDAATEGSVWCHGNVRFLGTTLWTDFALAIEGPAGAVSDPARAMRAAALGMGDYRSIRTSLGEPHGNRPVNATEVNRYRLDQTQVRDEDASAPERLQTVRRATPQVKMRNSAPALRASPECDKALCVAVPATDRALRPQDTARLHAAARAWLRAQLVLPFTGRTVVITHHAPHRGSLLSAFAGHWLSPAFVNDLPAEFFAAPKLWIHGHTHNCFDYGVGRTRIVCNARGPVGRRLSPGFRPQWVIEL